MSVSLHKSVAIILLSSRQEKELVLDCLKSLAKTDYPKELIKTILVDNKSTDDVVSAVKSQYPEVTVIENKENLGFTVGNNIGIRYALDHGYEYIVILNNDTTVDKDWIKEMIAVADSDEKIGSVQPLIYIHGHTDIINTDGNQIHFLGFAYCGNYKKKINAIDVVSKEITYASGAGMMVKNRVFRELGLFEEKLFIYHDDVEFGWRMRMAGYKIFLAPKAKIFHKYVFSKPSNRKWYLMERNRFIVIFENFKIRTLLLLLPASICMEIGLYWFAFTQGWLREKISADLYFINPINIIGIFHERKEKQKLRKIKDRDIISRFVGTIEFEDVSPILLTKVANPLFHAYWKMVRPLIFW